jgi:hypothetical protein
MEKLIDLLPAQFELYLMQVAKQVFKNFAIAKMIKDLMSWILVLFCAERSQKIVTSMNIILHT